MPMGVVRTLIPWLLCAALVTSAVVMSAQGDPATAAARAWRLQHESAILGEFMRFLAIPNVTTDRDGISRNAAALSAMLRARGITPQLLSVPHPQVASLRCTAAGNATRTPMDGPAAQAVISRGRTGARPGAEAADDGWQPSARAGGAAPRRAAHQHPSVEPRQQQSQLRREPPARKPVGRHRAGCGAPADGRPFEVSRSIAPREPDMVVRVPGLPDGHAHRMEAHGRLLHRHL